MDRISSLLTSVKDFFAGAVQSISDIVMRLIGMYKIYHIIPTVIIVFVLAGALIGLIRGGKRSLARIICIACSLVLSYFLAKLMGRFVAFGALKISELAMARSVAYDGLEWVARNGIAVKLTLRVLITPLMLPIVYPTSKRILRFIYKDLKEKPFFCNVKSGILNRLGGLGLGALSGAVGSFVLLLPIIGYLTFAVDSYRELDRGLLGENVGAVDEVVDTYIAPMTEGGIVNFAYDIAGEPIFNHLASSSMKGIDASLVSVFEDVNRIVADWNESVGDSGTKEFGEEQLLAVQDISEDIQNSPYLRALLSEVAHGASDAWLQGENFAGFERYDIGEDMAVIFDGLLRVMATSSVANINADLNSVSDIITLLSEYGALNGEFEISDEFIDDVVNIVNENRRMMPIYTALTQRGMQEIFGQIEDVDGYLEEYGDLINEVAGEIEFNGTPEELSENLKNVLANNGIDVTEEQSEMFSAIIMGNFAEGEAQTLTGDEILGRLYDAFGITQALK